ncbi:MAG: type II CRISPR-associated endonuclease Cas1 [Nitrospirae bacterium]|nr:type II CRISPR-associated endonuclease Cas1 [Nitrospirota bacterium]
MTERIVDISDSPARLSVSLDRLVIHADTGEAVVPFEDLAVLVVSHPNVSYTHAVLSGLCARGGILVTCNDKRLPTGMLLPLEGHFTQGERFAAQASSSVPTNKKLWRQVVKAKIKAQGGLLASIRGHDHGLRDMAGKVLSGDSSNMEAQASRRYWPALLGDGFHRMDSGDGRNGALNYGYAVLRAMVARAVCAAGLHPSLGIHHHNRYDAFRLADDLMEPYRPIVDAAVAAMSDGGGCNIGLDREAKSVIIRALTLSRFSLDGESRTLFDLAGRTASSLSAVFEGKGDRLAIPEL